MGGAVGSVRFLLPGGRALLAAGVLALGPALVAAPAYADTATPIASEPPGGATCLPGTSATCGQDTGVSPTPTATVTSTSTPSTSPSGSASPSPATSTSASSAVTSSTPEPVVTTIPITGSTSMLAKTGGGAAAGWGYAGTGLLVAGSALVLVAGRPRRAD